MAKRIDRKTFLSSVTVAGIGMIGSTLPAGQAKSEEQSGEARLGIIGLDTSHAPAFTNIIHNNPVRIRGTRIERDTQTAGGEEDPRFQGFRVAAAYPYGSRTIESSYSRIPRYIEDIQKLGVEIVDSIDELLEMVDHILLLTNDGHPRLEQAIQVMTAGKLLFMDKPLAGSLADVVSIMKASKRYEIPVFSSSALRYVDHAAEVRSGEKIGRVLGANTYSSSQREPSHPDLFWYGMHGVEMLFTVMGTGCESVTRKVTEKADMVVGEWENGRLGFYRGIREGSRGFGGMAFGTDGIQRLLLGPGEGYHGIYQGLVADILKFFRTGTPPIDFRETLEIYTYMEAADESRRRDEETVSLSEVLAEAGG